MGDADHVGMLFEARFHFGLRDGSIDLTKGFEVGYGLTWLGRRMLEAL